MQMKKARFCSFASWELLQSFVISWLLFCLNAKLFFAEKKQFSAVESKSASVERVIMINFYSCCQSSEKYNLKSKKAQACFLSDPSEYISVLLRSVIRGWGKNWLFKEGKILKFIESFSTSGWYSAPNKVEIITSFRMNLGEAEFAEMVCFHST